MIKGVTLANLGPIWYHSEPSDVPYSPNQFLGWDFFCCFLQQTGSSKHLLLPARPDIPHLLTYSILFISIDINVTKFQDIFSILPNGQKFYHPYIMRVKNALNFRNLYQIILRHLKTFPTPSDEKQEFL